MEAKEPKHHFAEAQEHLKWIQDRLKKGLEKSRDQRNKEEDECKERANEMANKEKDQKFAALLKASTFEKMVTYLHDFDLKGMFGEGIYSNEQIRKLLSTIPRSQKPEAFIYQSFYNALLQYSKIMESYKYDYQKEAEKLTGLINLYETYETDAKIWSKSVKDGSVNVLSTLTFEYGEGRDGKLWADRKAGTGWGTIYLYPDGTTKVDIDGAGRLYERMKKQAEKTEQTLSIYKGFVEALSGLVYETEIPLWSLLPTSLENTLEYPDAIPEQQHDEKAKYFRFRLKESKENGETITPEDEKWALYPDYNEVEMNDTAYSRAKSLIDKILSQWKLDRKKIKEIAQTSIQRK